MVKFAQRVIILSVLYVIQETIVSAIQVQTIFGMELFAVNIFNRLIYFILVL